MTKKLTKLEIAKALDAGCTLYNFTGKGLTHYSNYKRIELIKMLNELLGTNFQ